jgi:dienelactone hydrolase
MTINIDCPECDKTYRLPDSAAGKKFRCKVCDTAISVPADDVEEIGYAEEDLPPVRRKPAAKKSKGKKSKPTSIWSTPLPWIGIGGGGVLALALLVVFLSAGKRPAITAPLPIANTSVASSTSNPRPVANTGPGPADALFPIAQVPIPSFPERGSPRILQPSGVRMWFVQMSPSPTPGHSMAFRVYLPPTDAADHSIPCVLVAPAGSNLLVGNDMDGDDYHVETLPYAQAGMAVIFYSLDGGLADMQNANDGQFQAAYNKFRAAHAGTVNGRNALEYVLTKLPQVDPKKIYTAGHSSAGTVSLLMAEHEPRLAGSIAYAPCTDVEARLREGASDPTMQKILPNLNHFLKQSSPKTHVTHVGCPLFVFHANDDGNVKVGESQDFVNRLKAAGKQVDFQTVPTGNHYDSMVKQGIPAAIIWLNQQNSKLN